MKQVVVVLVLAVGMMVQCAHAQDAGYSISSTGTRAFSFGEGQPVFKILLEEANLGGRELELAEHTFPAGSGGGSHPHDSVEILYVLSGELEHTVNDTSVLLGPGMVGIVRPGDTVRHRVPSAETPAKVLITWAPGGEVDRIFKSAKELPADPG